MLPAPRPPAVISTAPRKPSRAGPASGAVANARSRERRWLTDSFVAVELVSGVSLGVAIGSGGSIRCLPGQFGQSRLGCRVDGGGLQRAQCPLGERVDAAFRGAQCA